MTFWCAYAAVAALVFGACARDQERFERRWWAPLFYAVFSALWGPVLVGLVIKEGVTPRSSSSGEGSS